MVLLGFWGVGRLPVQRLWGQVDGIRSGLAALVRIPEMPQSASIGTQTSLPAAALPSRTPTAMMATKTVPAAVVTGTLALTPTLAATAVVAATATPDLSYTIRAGDSLSGIGEITGIPWDVIAQLNGLNQYSSLQVGQKLVLPTPTPLPVAIDTPVVVTGSPTPAAQSTATATPTPTVTPAPTATTTPEPSATIAGTGTTYRVQRGDSLLVIGTRFGIPWETIAAANGLSARSVLHVGQQLIIPGANAPPAPANTARSVPTQMPPPAPAYPAPVLTTPGDNTPYSGDRVQIVFGWRPIPGLPADAQHQVEYRWTSGGVSHGTSRACRPITPEPRCQVGSI